MKIDIDRACEILYKGGVVAMPTETVYGLAASIESHEGINKIFSTKERPFFDPLIVHIASVEMAKDLVYSWPKVADVLAKAFWPGPMTMILKKNHSVNDLITSGLDSVGIRCPNHPIALNLISQMGHGLAAPSANKFTKTSPTTSSHVKDEFGDKVMILEGGSCEIGIESTIIGISDDTLKIFRPGKITLEEIQMVLEKENINSDISYAKSPVAPGQLEHHYMPDAPIVLVEDQEQLKDSNLPSELLNNPTFWKLKDDPAMVARELYAKFRELSKDKPSAIIIEVKKDTLNDQAWHGIWNRLTKASSFNLLSK
jgi:L-threonylcarbamoyladenylate synthase